MAKTRDRRKLFSSEAELGHWIAYQLKRRGISQELISRHLGCSREAVTRTIHGKTISKRIRGCIASTLNYPNWEQLTAAQRRSA